jgi:hypothetical protein
MEPTVGTEGLSALVSVDSLRESALGSVIRQTCQQNKAVILVDGPGFDAVDFLHGAYPSVPLTVRSDSGVVAYCRRRGPMPSKNQP